MFVAESVSRRMPVLVVVALMLALVGPALAAPPSYLEPATAGAPALLQFTAGGHVLGFAPGRVYLAGLDHALTVEFAGGQGSAPAGEAAPADVQTGEAPALRQVIYRGAWRGVDVVYSPVEGGVVESTYVVHPGASPADVRLQYNAPVQLMEDGTLGFAFETGMLTESAPVAFQDIEGQRVAVDVRFVLNEGLVGFDLGAYNPGYALTIDPNYFWHTFYGSTDFDYGWAIASDRSGNIYVAGESTVSWDGPGSTPPLHAYAGGNEIVVVKLNRSGAYQWHTFYGSSNFDQGRGITSDSGGNIYVTGHSTAPWNGPGVCTTPGVSPCPLHAYAGGADIVVIKLNSAGGYQWHTFQGSSGEDFGRAITSDATGVYATGASSATWNGPGACTTPGVSPCPLNVNASGYDMVVVKLNTAGAYQWHTFYGSSSIDYGQAITSDGSGVYAAGRSDGAWNGPGNCTTAGVSPCPLNAYAGGKEFAVFKLSTAGAYQWHTFYGSTSNDEAYAITSDGSGIYATGYSRAAWNGPGAVAPLNAHSGGTSETELVVVKLNSAGAYQWHTFYGSSGGDVGNAITGDVHGNIYVAGESSATWNGPGTAAPLHAHAGGASSPTDIAVVKLNSAGAYQWHTFYGSTDYEEGHGITSDESSIYVAGGSAATWNGPGAVVPLNAHTSGSSNGYDIAVLKVSQARSVRYATPAGSGDCSTWANACTLQAALTGSVNGDEIWASAGTYKPATAESNQRLATFQLKNGVAIYGGFAGTEAGREQRNPGANVTVLSGDIDNNDSQTPVITDTTTVTGNATNAYHVVTGATGATLDGFTITAGYSTNAAAGTNRGGGIYNNFASPMLANITFSGNAASYGGGMMNNGSSPSLANVTFSHNAAAFGGGMENVNSSPTLTNVTFSGNSVSGGLDSAGGGMDNSSSDPALTNVTFSGNSAEYGGGMANYSSSPAIVNTIFWGNAASSGGAQIFDDGSGTPSVSYSVVEGGYLAGTNIITTTPLLGTLGDYGGATQTVPLLAGSSAINTGDDAACPATDQRGVTRPQGPHCDIGAFEREPAYRVFLPLIVRGN